MIYRRKKTSKKTRLKHFWVAINVTKNRAIAFSKPAMDGFMEGIFVNARVDIIAQQKMYSMAL
jgi:hypothetical protein